MRIKFRTFEYEVQDGLLRQTALFDRALDPEFRKYHNIVEVQLAGHDHDVHRGAKQFMSSEWDKLRYVSHKKYDDKLEIIQQSQSVRATTHVQGYADTNALRFYTEIENISDRDVLLDSVSAFMGYGIGNIAECEDLHFYRFTNSHRVECQPRRTSFFDLGMFDGSYRSQKRICGSNVGTWSSKEELPQAIIENSAAGRYLMFQIESNNSWYYEIGDNAGEYYLFIGGANRQFGEWNKKLAPGEKYRTVCAAVAEGGTLNDVLGEMTKYRRHIARRQLDGVMPTIFNEYMHLSWDDPNEERTKQLAPFVAGLGIDCYVIDCGWHNEEPGSEVYPYVGQWKESKARYPHGIKAAIDHIHSLGMKAGLWIEPEIIGHLCAEMQAYYDDDCFFRRDGYRITEMGRQFLDFRHPKVVSYMNEAIRRMVEDYGVDYIKFDYNEDAGAGTDIDSTSLGDGLEKAHEAYYQWVKSVMNKYPDVIIEACSSGGLRMDYKTLALHPLISTSDQTDYKKYPYIAGNILSAVLPEQAAVWSYPVDSYGEPNAPFDPTYEAVNAAVTEDIVAMNMINSLLGCMHLASHIELLSKEKQELVKEGIRYFKSIANAKKRALPYLPLGFTDFHKDKVASGFIDGNMLYLAVWGLGGEHKLDIKLDKDIKSVKKAYPKKSGAKVKAAGNIVSVSFSADIQAVFLEIDLASSNSVVTK